MTTKNCVLATLFLFFLTLEVLIALDYLSRHRQFETRRVEVYQAFFDLHNQIGYVGMIHNFKNYLLRPAEHRYRTASLENYKIAMKQVKVIERLATLVLSESESMIQTRQMLEAYRRHLLELPGLLRQGISVQQVDSYVRFDDAQAKAEIENKSKLIIASLDVQLNTILRRSFVLGFIGFLGLVISLVLSIHYFFKAQKNALVRATIINQQLENNRQVQSRLQKTMLSLMEDAQHKKEHASFLNIQLTQKNKEIEQLIYTVSHDLKSPLVTINAFTQKLSRELAECISDKQQHRFNRIQDNVFRMEQLLSDLLELSRVVHKEIKKTMLSVENIVQQQFALLEGELETINAQIQVDSPLDEIWANETILINCLANLLTNAIHYRDENRLLIIHIHSIKTESHTILHIRDNGMGIAKEYHKKVFAIFERLSEGSKGTGVGLTIVKTIMEKHQGYVLLESDLGIGSCFSLYFPNQYNEKLTYG